MKTFNEEDRWFRHAVLDYTFPKHCSVCGNLLGYEHNDTDGSTIMLCTLCYSNEKDRMKREKDESKSLL
jgi:hypothetical protein